MHIQGVVPTVTPRLSSKNTNLAKEMGKKKKFIDKKKSATFQLMAQESSDSSYSSGPSDDHVFVRVDNNHSTPDPFFKVEEKPNSIFVEAPEDDEAKVSMGGVWNYRAQITALPNHIRKEILELGFPDDGYNYLTHLREIKNMGAGSVYYHNSKAKFDKIPRDIKAYDASSVEVSKINDVSEEKSVYSVASKSIGVTLQEVVDPEVAAMLDATDSSEFGSDVEDLEEDFVVEANSLEAVVNDELDDKLS